MEFSTAAPVVTTTTSPLFESALSYFGNAPVTLRTCNQLFAWWRERMIEVGGGEMVPPEG